MKQKLERKKVLGVLVDVLSRKEVVEIIFEKIEGQKNDKVMQIVTAYSEFFVAAAKDPEFRKVLNRANLVIPDGIGPLAAIDYGESLGKNDSAAAKLIKGAVTGLKILTGNIGETVPGFWLCSKLIELASDRGWKVFLLGGFGDVSYRLEKQLKYNYPNLQIKSDPGDQKLEPESESKKTLSKINAYRPDLLFIAYGPIKQEKWIAKNRQRLQAKVAMGVGGTFDELTGKVKPAPEILIRMGLKWLWRVEEEPKRLRRIFNAFPIFPLMIFRKALQRS